MNHKQITILMNIFEKFNIPENAHFIQHRNLNEFKYFKTEKINPTHKIFLYGSLKNNHKKKDTSKSFIKVGEIIISSIATFCNIRIFFENFNFICLCFSMFFFACFLFYWFGNINILRRIYDNWHRGFSWRWENHLHG
jgi:hypothetical protein